MWGALAWLEIIGKMGKRNVGFMQKTVLLGHRYENLILFTRAGHCMAFSLLVMDKPTYS